VTADAGIRVAVCGAAPAAYEVKPYKLDNYVGLMAEYSQLVLAPAFHQAEHPASTFPPPHAVGGGIFSHHRGYTGQILL
jgi:hypothetical protein